MCAWHHEILRLPEDLGAQCSVSVKVGSMSQVMGRTVTPNILQKAPMFGKKRWSVLKSPAMKFALFPLCSSAQKGNKHKPL